jgi:cytoskeletal protein RodZ
MMRKNRRYWMGLMVVLSLTLALGIWLGPDGPVAAQDATNTPRPTPTNVGDGPRETATPIPETATPTAEPTEVPPTTEPTPTTAPTSTPVPPPATDTPSPPAPTDTPAAVPPTSAPASDPPSPPAVGEGAGRPAAASAPTQPARTVPNAGFISVGEWSLLFVAVSLVGVVFGVRYLRHRYGEDKKRDRR